MLWANHIPPKTHYLLVHFMNMDDQQQSERLEIKHFNASPTKLKLMDACRSQAGSGAFLHGFSGTYNHQVRFTETLSSVL
jgi:hypothetical protein